jgi:uncharacterized membrane protein
MKHARETRNPERGSVAVVAAALLVVLFGFAALAIGQGYLYSRSRMVYAIADSAVAAGMGDLQAGNTLTAQTDATNMVDAHGVYTRSAVATANSSLQVTVSKSYPSFFGGLFGVSSRLVTATVTGTLNAKAPTLLALGGCAGTGVSLNGNTNMTINGNVQSNGPITYGTSPLATTTNGDAQSPCAGQPVKHASDTITGNTTQAAGNFNDPFLAVQTSLPPCDYGSLGSGYSIPFGNWGPGGVLAPGVYCSGANLSVTSPDPCMCIVANGVSFIATGDINFTSGGPTSPTSTISPAANMPDGIVAYSSGTGNPAVQFGNWNLTINGSLYAPHGQVMIGSQGTVVFTGSAIGDSVFLGMGAGATWTVGSPGGAAGTGWQMSQ